MSWTSSLPPLHFFSYLKKDYVFSSKTFNTTQLYLGFSIKFYPSTTSTHASSTLPNLLVLPFQTYKFYPSKPTSSTLPILLVLPFQSY